MERRTNGEEKEKWREVSGRVGSATCSDLNGLGGESVLDIGEEQ